MRFHFVQVERESVGHSHPRLQTSFSSLSLWKFWMRRWRMDTGHEDGRQQGKTCVLPGEGGGATSPSFSQMKSKRCSHNLCPDYAHYVKPTVFAAGTKT